MTTLDIAVDSVLLTGEEAFARGYPKPYELIDGRIVEMSPAGGQQGLIQSNINWFLDTFVSEHGLGWVMNGEVGLYTQHDPDRVRGADVAFFTREALPDGPPIGFIEAAPALVVEIMSPGDRGVEVLEKMREYFAIGAEQVWVVEPSRRRVHCYASPLRAQSFDEGATIQGTGSLQGFVLAVADLLR